MRSLFGLTLMLMTASARADFPDFNKIEESRGACVQNAGSSATVAACVSLARRQAEDALAVTAKEVKRIIRETGQRKPKLVGEALRRLESAQRAFGPYRDAQCEFMGVRKLGMDGEAVEVESCVFRLIQMQASSLISTVWK